MSTKFLGPLAVIAATLLAPASLAAEPMKWFFNYSDVKGARQTIDAGHGFNVDTFGGHRCGASEPELARTSGTILESVTVMCNTSSGPLLFGTSCEVEEPSRSNATLLAWPGRGPLVLTCANH